MLHDCLITESHVSYRIALWWDLRHGCLALFFCTILLPLSQCLQISSQKRASATRALIQSVSSPADPNPLTPRPNAWNVLPQMCNFSCTPDFPRGVGSCLFFVFSATYSNQKKKVQKAGLPWSLPHMWWIFKFLLAIKLNLSSLQRTHCPLHFSLRTSPPLSFIN